MGGSNTNVRQCVLLVTSLILTLQVIGLACSIVFYLYASSETYRDALSRAIFTSLYHKYQWKWLRRSRALEVSSELQQQQYL